MEEAIANDEELCQYLVEQDDNSMDTECEGYSSGTPNVAETVQNESTECSNDRFSNSLTTDKSNGPSEKFTIHNVPLTAMVLPTKRIHPAGLGLSEDGLNM